MPKIKEKSPNNALDSAFSALNLENRFLSRLKNLASKANSLPCLSPQKQRNIEKTKAKSSLLRRKNNFNHLAKQKKRLPQSQGKIISESLRKDASGLPYPKNVISSRWESSLLSQYLDLPVPIPSLSINNLQMTVGEVIELKIRVPPYPGSIYIKLWLQDIQTRTLLDVPRPLVDLKPNARGELETKTQIMIPLGVLAFSIQAIAIDPEREKESHKASLNLKIVK